MPNARKTSQDTGGTLSCDICQKEIPISEAINAEAQEYVLHFCGTACFDRWSKRAADQFRGSDHSADARHHPAPGQIRTHLSLLRHTRRD